MSSLLDLLQAASNSAASNVSAPVDAIAWLLKKAGIDVGTPVGGSDWMARQGLTRPVQQSGASLAGETAGLFAPIAAAAKAPQIARGLLQAGENLAAPATLHKQRGVIGFDPRFDPRVKEQQRLLDLSPVVEARAMQDAKPLKMADLEGMPFVTSMSDRTAAGGLLTGINDVKLVRPVDLRGGQDFMFDNPGQIWASAKTPAKAILDTARTVKEVTGKDPLYLPWRMAPSGGDFASMTGETMLSYAASSLGKRDAASLDRSIKALIPDWKGVRSEESVAQFRSAPDSVRKAVKNVMDTNFRERGGLGIGEARLAVADPKQYAGADGMVMNVGRISSGDPLLHSSHPSYPYAVPGEGIGRLSDEINITQLLPQLARDRGIADARKPRATDIRALQMKPYAGFIDDALLKSLGF